MSSHKDARATNARIFTAIAAFGAIAMSGACKSSDAGAGAPPPPSAVTFPSTFQWGAATAAFQVEKGNDDTEWGTWVTTTGKIQNGDLPDIGGPDALAHIDDDIALMQSMGHTAYRFSIEWARLYPTEASFTSDTPDPTAVAAYDELLTKLQAAHIRPFVTLHHFSTPSWLSDPTQSAQPQAWERPEMIDLFTQYASRIAARWGDKIDDYITINEPLNLAIGGYLQGTFPPGVALQMDRLFAVVKAEAQAHVKAYEAIHAADTIDADGDGTAAWVSMAFHQRGFHPLDPTDPDDVTATANVQYIWNSWLMNVVVKGNWDDDFNGDYLGPNDFQDNPAFANHVDFLGVNYYSDTLISAHHGLVIPVINAAIIEVDMPTTRPKTEFGWDIYPEGMGEVLDQAAAYKLPIVITENGIADSTDSNRARFLAEHLYQVGWAMQRGADVRGYFHWALIDNFEWASGFCPKFGLASYDQTTKVRTLRASGTAYKNTITAGSIKQSDIDAMPAYVAPTFTCN